MPDGGKGTSKREEAEERVRAASSELGIPLAADPDVVYLDPEAAALHGLQPAIGRNALIATIAEEGLWEGEGRHFPGPRECERRFADSPEAVAETHRLAAACDLDLRRSKPVFPRLTFRDGETAYSRLAEIAFRGIVERGTITADHLDRLARELRVIEKLRKPRSSASGLRIDRF